MTGWPHYDEEQIAEVAEVLRSGKVNAWTGPYVTDFERQYEAYLGRKHAIALANGSVALDLALKVIGLKPGDEVIVTPRTFIASASCVPLAGGVPVFADIDPDTQNVTAETIAEKITPRTRAVIVVHLAGWPCDMDPICELARKHGILVIEDCAQAHGAFYKGKPIGSFGEIASFSFCQDKIITTGGEGGLLAMDDEELWKAAWSFKDHGKSFDTVFHKEHPPGFRWLHEDFGTNWRMTALQAVLGSVQLSRLPDWQKQRRNNAQMLIDACKDSPALRTPVPDQDIEHAWYRFYTFVRPERLREGWDRDRIMHEISGQGVPCFVGSCSEVYLEQAFSKNGLRPKERLPVAKELGETSLAFLVDPSKDSVEMKRVADVVRSVMQSAAKQSELI